MEHVLTSDGLSKYYKSFRALEDFSVHIPKGSIYGLVGKNGAGKTTFIRIICGLQKPTRGSYSLFGTDSRNRSQLEKQRARMGAVVETPSLYTDMSARDNLIQQYRLLGRPEDGSIEQLLELVGLSGTGRKKAKNFSLGMRQRLGIAVALAGNPDFLVLDEPINGLDPQGIVEIRELLLKLNREMGITVLISSHILDELSRIATHYGFVDGGHIIKEISAKELENAGRKYLTVKAENLSVFLRYLDERNIACKVVDDSSVIVYGDIDINEAVLSLNGTGFRILGASEHEESLESFFINLTGGKDNA